ncbi:hypothetical protein ACHAXT_001102 [Thalassiosira profunda]
MMLLWLLVAFALLSFFADVARAAVNEEILQCYASSALESQPDGKIICPVGTSFCIKEVVNATSRSDCGTVEGTYYGRDVWDRKLGQCVYRKCSSTCPTVEQDRTRTFGGDEEDFLLGKLPTPVFNRTSYCCDTNLCNGADGRGLSALVVVLTAGVLLESLVGV